MTEQQYRVIADRDKGDDPQWADTRMGDRVTERSEYGIRTDKDASVIVRIERPVPTELCLSTAHHDGHEWGGHNGQPGTGYWCPGLNAAPHPPTREQIAEAWDQARANRTISRESDGSMLPVDAFKAGITAAFALIQNGADRG